MRSTFSYLINQTDRRVGLTCEQFKREYLGPLRPVILTDAISHWRAMVAVTRPAATAG